jgi:hypothetical protein
MEPGWTVRSIRTGIWTGVVCFPSQAPDFQHLQRHEIQWRVALLYFVRRWSAVQIARRYGLTRQRVLQMLRQWIAMAIAQGYVDHIPPSEPTRGLVPQTIVFCGLPRPLLF